LDTMERITVKDIAKELNISVGTVSKALSGKAGVSGQMRVRVCEAAERRGYSANSLAQGLARKPTRVGIVMPSVWKEFYGYLKFGIDMELNNLQDQKIQGHFVFVSGLYANEEYRKALRYFMAEKMDAVILCPALAHDYADLLDELREQGVKTIILGNPLKEAACYCEIRIASEMAGSLAAEFASLLCVKGKLAAVFIGNKDMEDHKRKAEHFQSVAAEKQFQVSGVYETQDDVDIAYALTKKVISEQPGLNVIYVATGNSVAVCKSIIDMGAFDGVKVIGTDIFPDVCPYVESGLIIGLIYQNPIRMGRMSVSAIYNAVSGEQPEREILVYPQLVLRSNYAVYADYLKKAEEGMGGELGDGNEMSHENAINGGI